MKTLYGALSLFLVLSVFAPQVANAQQMAEAAIDRGIEFFDQGDPERAIEEYTEAIRLEPNNSWAYYFRGWSYGSTDRFDLAIADFDQVIRLEPNFSAAYYYRGLIHFNKGLNTDNKKSEYDLAIADFDQALRLNPNDSETYSTRGTLYSIMGEYDLAIADADQAIRLEPNDAESYNIRGLAYRDKGDLDVAIADFEAALRIDPNLDYVRNNLDHARQQRGR